MANRNRNNVKIETTIEACRSEAKWKRVIELAEELKTGSPNYGNLHAIFYSLCLYHHLHIIYLTCLKFFSFTMQQQQNVWQIF